MHEIKILNIFQGSPVEQAFSRISFVKMSFLKIFAALFIDSLIV